MPKYKATAYIRLSYTDDHSSESDSVSNQRKLIELVRANQIDCIIVKDYCAIIGLNQKDLENQGILA